MDFAEFSSKVNFGHSVMISPLVKEMNQTAIFRVELTSIWKKFSFEPDLNQRPMDFCNAVSLLQSTALPTELSKDD